MRSRRAPRRHERVATGVGIMRQLRGRLAGSPRLAAIATTLEIVASIALYVGSAYLLDPILGAPSRALAAPIVGYWGLRRGMLGGFIAAATAFLTLPFLNIPLGKIPPPPLVELFRLVVFAGTGLICGRMSELSRRLRTELAAREVAEAGLREDLALFRIFFEGNPHPMWIFDVETLEFLAVNQAKAKLYGYSVEEFRRMTLEDVQLPENLPALRALVAWPEPGKEKPYIFDRQHRRKDGSVIDIEIISQVIMYRGRPARLGLGTDVTEQRRVKAALQFQADHDALTGLPNRASFQRGLERAIEQARATHGPFSLFLLDLDRFKEINDTLGHSYGDQALQLVAARLRGVLRPGDILARLGGDEFGILLPGAELSEAERIGARLLSTFHEPFGFEGRSFELGASIGIAAHPDHGGDDAGALLQMADVAMYAAKRDRGGVVVYGPRLQGVSYRPHDLAADLRRGIDSGQLVLHYQPQVELRTGRVCGSEALVRWNHPKEGMISPARFIPMAEQTGLIGPMSYWVFTNALARCRAWRMAGLNLDIAVNLSPVCFRDEQLVEKITGLLDAADVPAPWLTIEITEDAMMLDPEAARGMLCRLRELGLRISVDDFGTGRSSLAYLRDLPIDEIKLDRAFLRGLTTDRTAQAIVRAVIRLGTELGVRVIAEGIEDEETLTRLHGMGCGYAQGFLLGRPMPEADFVAWLARRPARRATQLSP